MKSSFKIIFTQVMFILINLLPHQASCRHLPKALFFFWSLRPSYHTKTVLKSFLEKQIVEQTFGKNVFFPRHKPERHNVMILLVM